MSLVTHTHQTKHSKELPGAMKTTLSPIQKEKKYNS